MPKAVFDTVVFVRALLDSRSASGRLIFEQPSRYRLFLSTPVIEEVLDVLGRKELIDRFHLKQTDYPGAIKRLLKSMERAEIVEFTEIRAVSRDPKDDKILATAKAADADFLVSADRDILDLKEYEGIKIISAETFLKILEEKK